MNIMGSLLRWQLSLEAIQSSLIFVRFSKKVLSISGQRTLNHLSLSPKKTASNILMIEHLTYYAYEKAKTSTATGCLSEIAHFNFQAP
ncbi:unnamed protein product [Blumeria hordei]|uniref:Uncharacterized protein n=1 Tax=Blumeria hordei TaxID=2867405 RepID=A0A383UNU2_BLUHO|nr:unnamed protein product [Blumeria hordei]